MSSLFSVNAVRMSRRSTRSTASRGTAATSGDDQPGPAAHAATAAREAVSMCSRCQSSSISRHQSRCAWSARPETCSCSSRRRRPGRNCPRARAVSPSRTSPASVAQVLAEPARDRDAEARLAARRDERRERVRERAAERDLAAATVDLQPVGERDAELEDARGRGAASEPRASAPSRRCPPSAAGRRAGTCGRRGAGGPAIPSPAGPSSSHAGTGSATNAGSHSSARSAAGKTSISRP